MAHSLPAQQQVEKLTATCSVCRGPAAPHLHYGAVCCYSCRAFFRRGVAREYECVAGTDSCVIDTVTRRNCQKCRFNRCLYAGMRPDWVDATLKKKYYNNNKNKSPTSHPAKQEQVYWEPPQFYPSTFEPYPYQQDRIQSHHHHSKKDGYEMVELLVPVHHQQYTNNADTLEQVLDIVNTEEFNFTRENSQDEERRGERKRSMSQRSLDQVMDEDAEEMNAKKIFLEPRKMIDPSGCQDYQGFQLYDDSMYTNSVHTTDINLQKEKSVGDALTFFREFEFLEENNVFDSTSEYPESTNSSCSSTATTPRIMLEDISPFFNIETLVDECFAQELDKQPVVEDQEESEIEIKEVKEEGKVACSSVDDKFSSCDMVPSTLLNNLDFPYSNCKQLVYMSNELNSFFRCFENAKYNFWMNFGEILYKYRTPTFNQSIQQLVKRYFHICKTPNKQVKQMLKKLTTFEKLVRNNLSESSWFMILVFLFFNLPRFSLIATYSQKSIQNLL